MQEALITIGMLAGGLGMFLLAVSLITEGLTLAAGQSLRNLLGTWTRSLARGIFTGLTITSLVQSSSAVTVATIGFVNAGLIGVYQSLGVVYGANIGTTMTAWLVALLGFKVKVAAFALPMIGVGMLMRLTGGETRRASLGLALAGFGLFFTGIDVLREAFEGLAGSVEVQTYTLDGIAGVFLYAGIGFLLTLLTQSSSAAIAITLTATTGGLLGLHAAAAMVVGTNVGTTSTAALAVIGATSNAKRVAAAHIIFNLATGLLALLSLPLLFWTVKTTGELLGLQDIPAVTLALFHTTFNVVGVLLMWPLTRRLSKFLKRRFVTQEELEARPRFLDKTIAVSPVLALNALVLECSRIASIARRMALEALSTESIPGKRIAGDHAVAEKLSRAIAKFITRLEKGSLSEGVAEQLAMVLRAEQHLLACAGQALLVARAQGELGNLTDDKLMQEVANYRAEVVSLMKITNPEEERISYATCDQQLQRVQESYENVKAALLLAGAQLRVPVPVMIDTLDQNSRIRRMARQMVKAMQYLAELNAVAGVSAAEFGEPPRTDADDEPRESTQSSDG